MAINYGQPDFGKKERKPRAKSLMNHDALNAPIDELSDEQLKQFSKRRLIELARQTRAPHVASSAAKEIWERVEPKKERPEASMTAADAARIADIYEKLFRVPCPQCGYVEKVQ